MGNLFKPKMDSGYTCISDKFLESEEVAEYEAGRPLEFFSQLSKEQMKLRYELAMLNQISMTEEHEDALIPHVKGETSHLNRYSDILPYKHSAIVLDNSSNSEDNTYINANYIPGPFGDQGELIACQGPKANTIKDYWRMVKQENITTIFMLCKCLEDGRPKWEQYWPDIETSLKFEDINLEVKCESDKAESDHIYHREFSLIDTASSETISTVKQIHYMGWPDHGVPKKKELSAFDSLVELTLDEYNNIRESEETKRLLFHCSAGIGRTGTLLSILHIVSSLNKKVKDGETITDLSVFSTVRKLREHRFHLVQSESQYLFIFEYLAQHLKKIKLI